MPEAGDQDEPGVGGRDEPGAGDQDEPEAGDQDEPGVGGRGGPPIGEPGHRERGESEVGEQGGPASGDRAERQRLEGEFLLAIRRGGSLMQLLGQVSAERIGINVTDLNCLNIVALTGSMTAGELARRTGLTTASITGVLDRLEEGGFVRRERDPHDRRRVMVNLNAGPGLREVGATFGPVVKAWRTAADGYSDDELRLLLGFHQQLEEIVRGQLARLGEEAK